MLRGMRRDAYKLIAMVAEVILNVIMLLRNVSFNCQQLMCHCDRVCPESEDAGASLYRQTEKITIIIMVKCLLRYTVSKQN